MLRFGVRFLVICAALLGVTLACTLSGETGSPQAGPPVNAALITATPNVRATAIAERTQTAAARRATPTPQRPTLRPSSTPGPSSTPARQPTGSDVTPPVSTCDRYAMIKDVTIPDGTLLAPETKFTKTWRLKNTGTCAWLADYEVYFESGDAMVGPAAVKIMQNVAPGETVDVSITLTAPKNSAVYRSYYRMRNSNGEIFGSSIDNGPFYLEIWVGNPREPNLRLDLIGYFCDAEWSVDGRPIPCQGPDDPLGYTRIMNNGRLTGGYKEDEHILLTVPAQEEGSIIRGRYPAFKIINGDHFMAVLGCEWQYTQCDVTYQLDYQVGEDGPVQNYAHRRVVYDQPLVVMDVNLDQIAGLKVHLILTVIANNDSGENRAMWVKPRIMYIRPAATVTATPTP